MACYHPIPAFRTPSGQVKLHKDTPDSIPLQLPCGGCLGCRADKAKAWTLRCQLELHDYESTVFTTLTYDDEHVPRTLPKPSETLPLWLKRLRKKVGPIIQRNGNARERKSLRFFACAEYGERTQRPHFHAILFGLGMQHADVIEKTWGMGHTRTEPISLARIAYVAGYCQKKIGYKRDGYERTDFETGEVYHWQPPYIQMSRRPGIGARARDKYKEQWRLFAIKDGNKMAVPRYLHDAWKAQATPEQIEALLYEKSKLALSRDTSKERLAAAEQIAQARHALKAETRNY